jgi:inactivated superfamily I helicase
MMTCERVFLGWDGPCLPAAARWLLERFDGNQRAALDEVMIVVPGRRAGRRLLELLVAEAGGKLLHPPRHIITPGQLPSLLCEVTTPIASDLDALLARVAALRGMSRVSLMGVIPFLPDAADVLGWIELARELATLSDDLATALLTPGDVPVQSASLDAFADADRWQVLQRMEEQYQRTLDAIGRADANATYLRAVRDDACAGDRPIVLIGVLDLTPLPLRLLEQQRGEVIALIHAPPSEGAGFTAMGTLEAEQWEHRRLDLDPARVHVVDRPRDQVDQTLRLLGAWSREAAGGPSINDITVGLGDQTQADAFARTFDLLGLRARPAVGRAMSSTGPVRLLDAFATYLRGARARDFAALLRHPDIETWLMHTLRQQDGGQPGAAAWLQAIDDYMTQHLPATLDGTWLSDDDAMLPRVYELLHSLLPADAAKSQPLSAWSPAIAQLLTAVYDVRELSATDDADVALVETIARIGVALREQSSVADAVEPSVSLADALRLLQSQLASDELPNTTPSPAIEMLGWLELQLDDAGALIITGVNEGAIPASVNADPFLPDRLRSHLGLTDNRRRYVRDLAAMTAILHSRPRVELITGRVDAEGNPLTPSRLLLATRGRELAERVLTFYDRPEDAASHHAPLQLLTPGGASRFLIPAPLPPAKPIERVRVTAFRDYIACPYRFYLAHVLHLTDADDDVRELDPLAFGNLAHDVLEAFAQSELVASTQPDDIAAFLAHALEQRVRLRYGNEPAAVVIIQREQLRRRLMRFAVWQAQQAAEGWAILPAQAERNFTLPIEVQRGEPLIVRGRIDRIDLHPEHGHRIVDYKTGDSGMSPDAVHRQGPKDGKTWVDLQLPLYHMMARQQGIVGPIELGYISLPKKLQDIGLQVAGWGQVELDDAAALVRDIAQRIRDNRFWPPGEPAKFPDAFTGICMDDHGQRRDVIAETTTRIKRGGGA